jgi:hypothetical protein
MTETLEFQSRVGADGILDLHVPLEKSDAGAEVVVTIRLLRNQAAHAVTDPAEWYRLLDESYGSCAGLGLERPEQGEFEDREPLE